MRVRLGNPTLGGTTMLIRLMRGEFLADLAASLGKSGTLGSLGSTNLLGSHFSILVQIK